jgi:hypothetical protein
MAATTEPNSFEFDVALSFAGEDREYVEHVAELLAAGGIRVFYDRYLRTELWGKDLYEHLDDVYRNRARFCVLFASKHYAQKVWTTHERKSAQARALRQHSEYVLPARFDDTPIPGVRPTVGYVDLRGTAPREFAELIVEKVTSTGAEESAAALATSTGASRRHGSKAPFEGPDVIRRSAERLEQPPAFVRSAEAPAVFMGTDGPDTGALRPDDGLSVASPLAVWVRKRSSRNVTEL